MYIKGFRVFVCTGRMVCLYWYIGMYVLNIAVQKK